MPPILLLLLLQTISLFGHPSFGGSKTVWEITFGNRIISKRKCADVTFYLLFLTTKNAAKQPTDRLPNRKIFQKFEIDFKLFTQVSHCSSTVVVDVTYSFALFKHLSNAILKDWLLHPKYIFMFCSSIFID